MLRILTVNPGATSTKLAAFSDAQLDAETTIRHNDKDLARMGSAVLGQLEYRVAAARAWLQEIGCADVTWDAVAGRGGLLKPLASGTYQVNGAMLDDLAHAIRGEHASNLGAFMARELAGDGFAVIVDPVSVDEMEDVARISGLCGLERECLSHALNTKAVAKRHAAAVGESYAALELIVVHLGSGISVSAHRDGRMIDVNNAREEGPFATDRSGGLPALALVQHAIEEGWSTADAQRRLFREGGMYSYLQTRDLAEVLQRVAIGDSRAEAIVEAMLYQVRKEVGAMAAVLNGEVDGILLTGGMAHAEYVTRTLQESLDWIAPVYIYPGEDEMQALAEGVLRVLREEEPLLEY